MNSNIQTLVFNVFDRNGDKIKGEVEVVSLIDVCSLLEKINNDQHRPQRATVILNHIGDNPDDYANTVYLKSPWLEGRNGVYVYDEENHRLFTETGRGVELVYLDSWALEQLLKDYCELSEEDIEKLSAQIFQKPRTAYDIW